MEGNRAETRDEMFSDMSWRIKTPAAPQGSEKVAANCCGQLQKRNSQKLANVILYSVFLQTWVKYKKTVGFFLAYDPKW